MKKVCKRCFGRGKIMGLGCMYVKCKKCNGVGSFETDRNGDLKENVVKEQRKMGRPKKEEAEKTEADTVTEPNTESELKDSATSESALEPKPDADLDSAEVAKE